MTDILLDCAEMTDRAAAHEYLADMLSLPGYYGRNLDALYDCLCEMPPCRVIFVNAYIMEQPGNYGQALLDTFFDAAESNPGLVISVKREEKEND